MSNKNYVRGRRFEYERKLYYESKGYLTMRTSGSHGPFDLILVEPGKGTYLIQCKVTKSEATAKRLIKAFETSPPLKLSPYYGQQMVVKVDGNRILGSEVLVVSMP